jgi:hypothetical protein
MTITRISLSIQKAVEQLERWRTQASEWRQQMRLVEEDERQ